MQKGRKLSAVDINQWTVCEVGEWLEHNGFSQYKESFLHHQVNGQALLLLTEKDIKEDLGVNFLGHLKVMCLKIAELHDDFKLPYLHLEGSAQSVSCVYKKNTEPSITPSVQRPRHYSSDSAVEANEAKRFSGKATKLKPEYLKTLCSCLYMFLVTWITAIVMVFVHDRVPDKERHPPLPDIFLDNVPHISWAFELCEVTILVLSAVGSFILYFHKHRSILLRRFAALCGSVFLLRCATMFITSLSVPGHHQNCAPRTVSDIWTKLHQALVIWQGGGLSIKGVRTCGDYMFSGHTAAITLLNFFITEYTPRKLYYLHIASWVLNAFGIFFILAAHEHYSIDVFISFYITSRMFLYYHSLANNRALHQRDSFRTKVWFPMFGYFEANIDGIVPNEYSNPLCWNNLQWFWENKIQKPYYIVFKNTVDFTSKKK